MYPPPSSALLFHQLLHPLTGGGDGARQQAHSGGHPPGLIVLETLATAHQSIQHAAWTASPLLPTTTERLAMILAAWTQQPAETRDAALDLVLRCQALGWTRLGPAATAAAEDPCRVTVLMAALHALEEGQGRASLAVLAQLTTDGLQMPRDLLVSDALCRAIAAALGAVGDVHLQAAAAQLALQATRSAERLSQADGAAVPALLQPQGLLAAGIAQLAPRIFAAVDRQGGGALGSLTEALLTVAARARPGAPRPSASTACALLRLLVAVELQPAAVPGTAASITPTVALVTADALGAAFLACREAATSLVAAEAVQHAFGACAAQIVTALQSSFQGLHAGSGKHPHRCGIVASYSPAY